MSTPLRPHIRQIAPYQPGRPIDEVKREYGLDRVIKLASNENPLGPSPMAIEEVRRAAESMHLYPDGAAFRLREAIANKFEVSPDSILLGNGSDELIHFIGLMYLDSPDDEVIVGKPTFSRYDSTALLNKAKVVEVPLDEQLRHDLPAMAAAVTERTKVIFIANPHNPTGTIVAKAEFDRFLSQVPSRVTVVLDEAYIEFAEGEDVPNSIDYVASGASVIGLRTFSKVYGLAGIRIGYGFASPEAVDGCNRVREPFNVNSLAQAAAVGALKDADYLARSVAHNRTARTRLNQIFEKVGAKVYESHANFSLADIGRPAEPVFQELLQQGVIVRSGAWFGLPTCLRVTVGTNEELDYFEETIMKVLSPAVSR